MPDIRVLVRIPLLAVLLFGTAQPSANFFACAVRIHQLAEKGNCGDGCRHSTGPIRPGRGALAAKPYIPCCASVLPFTSAAEKSPDSDHGRPAPIAILATVTAPEPHFRALRSVAESPPPNSGIEILDLSLRI